MKLLLTWVAVLGVASPAAAQPYPAKPVKIIVPVGPGRFADPQLSQALDRLGTASRAIPGDEYRRYLSNEIARRGAHVRAARTEPE